jgi:hypothetical protein
MNRDSLEQHRQAYNNWEQKYSPNTFLEYDGPDGANFNTAKNTPNEHVWTEHGTCEDPMITAGFHFFGEPVRCCWDTYGWYITETSSGNTNPDDYESYKTGMYAECECYNEETETGNENCQQCEGQGWTNYYFD